ncbi:hypothetical protein KA005_42650 [bacterium]|nr:hypothetical protein [bacterium]
MRQEEKKDLLPLLRSLGQGQRKALLKKLKGMIEKKGRRDKLRELR